MSSPALPDDLFRLLLHETQDVAFILLNPEGLVSTWNVGAELILGYRPADVMGRPFSLIFTEEDRRDGAPEHELETARRNGRAADTRWHLRADGSLVFLDGVTNALRDPGGAVVGFAKIARDITERARARDEIHKTLAREQEARTLAEAAQAQLQRRADEEAAFRHLASALTGAVEMGEVLFEITSRATHVTRADGVYIERIVVVEGQPVVEVVSSSGKGAPPKNLRIAYPGSMTEEILRARQPVILTDMNHFGREMAPYLTDTCSDCEVLVTPLVAENEPLGALVLLNSRSSGRHFGDADTLRARTLGDLTSLALRRVRLLEQEREAKDRAEAAVRVRDETLGIVSHDLRNPLTRIALSADLLAETVQGDDVEIVETIRTAARQMERLIQDLLDVARLEAGRFAVEKTPLATEPIILAACDSHRPIAERKKQKIVCTMSEQLPMICGDYDRLLQVFGNLIGNALKFTPERGTVTITATPVRSDVEFRIEDTGPGIPEADIGNVFRPYWQSKKTAHMGAGLGLAIVRGIVEAHGGTVRVANSPGGGALFTFRIPAA